MDFTLNEWVRLAGHDSIAVPAIRYQAAESGRTEQQVRERMARQMPEAELITYADHVVINDGRPLLPQLMPVFHV